MSETADDAAAIESFAALLDETGPGRHHRRPDDADPQLVALLDVTRMLARVARPRFPALAEVAAPPTPQFRAELLNRLMSAFGQADGTPGPSTRPAPQPARDQRGASIAWPVNGSAHRVAPRPRRGDDDPAPGRSADPPDLGNEKTQVVRTLKHRLSGRARLAVLAGVAGGALAISGVSLASSSAVPGDTLYSVKNLGEHARLLLASSDAERGHLHLDFAAMRLVETRQVGPDDVAGVLAEMDRETTEGARLLFAATVGGAGADLIDDVATFVSQQRAALLALQAEVPRTIEPARHSLGLLAQIEIRANELRTALADGCSVAETDQLGPKPTC